MTMQKRRPAKFFLVSCTLDQKLSSRFFFSREKGNSDYLLRATIVMSPCHQSSVQLVILISPRRPVTSVDEQVGKSKSTTWRTAVSSIVALRENSSFRVQKGWHGEKTILPWVLVGEIQASLASLISAGPLGCAASVSRFHSSPYFTQIRPFFVSNWGRGRW